MNSFLMPLAQMLAMSEGAGGLFDFNATLPIMGLQFIALTTILTLLIIVDPKIATIIGIIFGLSYFVFYKSLINILKRR